MVKKKLLHTRHVSPDALPRAIDFLCHPLLAASKQEMLEAVLSLANVLISEENHSEQVRKQQLIPILDLFSMHG